MRKPKKYHYIYKTTNLIKNYFYIGMHSTDNLEDGYLGSGKRLRYCINKYGKENHIIEILEFLPSREELKTREKEIVNEDLLKDPLCINMKVGGEGGGTPVSEVHRSILSENGKRTGSENGKKVQLTLTKEERIRRGKKSIETQKCNGTYENMITNLHKAALNPISKQKRKDTWAAKRKTKYSL